jgi:hypothetical protein
MKREEAALKVFIVWMMMNQDYVTIMILDVNMKVCLCVQVTPHVER